MTEGGEDIRYKIAKDGREGTIERGSCEYLMDLLKQLGIPVDGAIVLFKNVPIALDRPLNGLNDLTIIEVSSGG